MLRDTTRFSIALLALATVGGCGGGKKKRTDQASTVAPSTSSQQPGVTPVTSGTGGQAPITTSTVPTVPVTPVSNDAYVTSFLLGEMQVLDLNTATVKTRFPVGRGPMAVAVNGNNAYVANSLDGNVAVVDRLTNSVTQTIDVKSTKVTGISAIDNVLQPLVRPVSIAVTPNGQKAFTANLLNVTSVDLIGMKPLKSIFALNIPNLSNGIAASITNFLTHPLAAAGPMRVAASNTRAFVTNVMTNNVSVISANDDKVMFNTPVGKMPFGVATANGKAYVACVLTNEIFVLDAMTGSVIRSFKAGLMPMDIAASPSGDKVYIANLAGGDITIIDTTLDIPLGTLPAGLPLLTIFQQLGVAVPGGSSSGLMGALNGLLAGFTAPGGAGSGSSTLGSLLGALTGGSSGSSSGGLGGLLNPQTIISALMSALLGYMGINQTSLANLNMPAIGIASVSVNQAGDRVITANWFMGQVTSTDTNTFQVTGLMPGSTGMGPAAVAGVR